MTDPFAALGLPARPDLDDETVHAAWRGIAAATHPDRPGGGDLPRYTRASAAYAELRSGWGRSEAYADLHDADPGTFVILSFGGEPPPPPAFPPPPTLQDLRQLPARIWHGHRLRMVLRALAAALLYLAALHLLPAVPVPADIGTLVIW